MKMKKFLALSTASVMALSMAACGSTDNGGAAESSVASTTPATAEASSEAAAPAEVTSLNYAELTLGEDYTDITTTIKVLTNRTDLLEDGAAVPFQTYIDAFNEMYPNKMCIRDSPTVVPSQLPAPAADDALWERG